MRLTKIKDFIVLLCLKKLPFYIKKRVVNLIHEKGLSSGVSKLTAV